MSTPVSYARLARLTTPLDTRTSTHDEREPTRTPGKPPPPPPSSLLPTLTRYMASAPAETQPGCGCIPACPPRECSPSQARRVRPGNPATPHPSMASPNANTTTSKTPTMAPNTTNTTTNGAPAGEPQRRSTAGQRARNNDALQRAVEHPPRRLPPQRRGHNDEDATTRMPRQGRHEDDNDTMITTPRRQRRGCHLDDNDRTMTPRR